MLIPPKAGKNIQVVKFFFLDRVTWGNYSCIIWFEFDTYICIIIDSKHSHFQLPLSYKNTLAVKILHFCGLLHYLNVYDRVFLFFLIALRYRVTSIFEYSHYHKLKKTYKKVFLKDVAITKGNFQGLFYAV